MLLLHLSDIHFKDAEIDSPLDPNANMRAKMVLDAATKCTELGEKPAAILITGDLSNSGSKSEFLYATTWLEQLCRECGTTLPAVFIVPGNHDVVRTEADSLIVQTIHRQLREAGTSVEGVTSSYLRDSNSSKLLYKPLENYNSFAAQFFCDLAPPRRTSAKRELTFDDGSTLCLWGLNSTLISSSRDDDHPSPPVGPARLVVDASYNQIVPTPGTVHLAMCHHPFSWLLNGVALRDFLNDNIQVHLFGHEHENRIDQAWNYVRLFASAAQPSKGEPNWQPGYNLIQLGIETEDDNRYLAYQMHIRVWQRNPGIFVPKYATENNPVFGGRIGIPSWRPMPSPSKRADVAAGASTTETGASQEESTLQSLRDVSIRFFKLSFSQKSVIAGTLGLLEDEDENLPDFERSRRVLLRASQRDMVAQLDAAIERASTSDPH